jgi:hypothetical protein
MPDKEPVKPTKAPDNKAQKPVEKPSDMPGGMANLIKVQDSQDKKRPIN